METKDDIEDFNETDIEVEGLFSLFKKLLFGFVVDTSQNTEFCYCKKCSWMPSPAERVCCKEKKYIVKMPGDLCVTEHEDFKKIINKVE